MDEAIDIVIDFVRVRQLNIAVAALITLVYLIYQYRGFIFKSVGDDLDQHGCRLSSSRSRSLHRSRSRSRTKGNYHDYKIGDTKHRRGRKPTRRCPDCSLCNFEQ